jgi:hypothetical protein
VEGAPPAAAPAGVCLLDDDALCDAVRELATLPVMQVAALVQPRFPARTVEAVRQRIIFLDPWDRRDD